MGNYGFNENTKKPTYYQADSIPELLATPDSSYISVGGVVSGLLKSLVITICSVTSNITIL